MCKNIVWCCLFAFLTLTSCGKKSAGAFSLKILVLEDADNGISNVHNIEFSKVYFIGDKMLEVVPVDKSFNYCYIENNYFSGYYSNLDELNFDNKIEVKQKKRGAVTLADQLEGYNERITMNDTVLEDLHLKRFAINTENEYSVFYIGDKLDIPFSLNKKIENDYKGTIRRVDTYQRNEDRFVSLKLNYSDTIPSTFYNILK